MDTSITKPCAWKIALSVFMSLLLTAGGWLARRIWHNHSTLALFQRSIPQVILLVIVFGAPWLGAWGNARIPCSPSFMWQLRLTALALFLAETLSLFHYAPLPMTAVWIPMAGALILAELAAATYTLVYRVVGLSPSLAPRARRVVWAAALGIWIAQTALNFLVLPPLWEGPTVILRPIARALVGEQPAPLPLALLACAVLVIHLAARRVSSRIPIVTEGRLTQP
jgi:hypothetical protein